VAGAGIHAYWAGGITIAGHANKEHRLYQGTISARSYDGNPANSGNLVANTPKVVELKISNLTYSGQVPNGRQLILKPTTIYAMDFRFILSTAGDLQCVAERRIWVKQGAANTPPTLIKSETIGTDWSTAGSGVLPTGWAISFDLSTNQAVRPKATLQSPTAGAWQVMASVKSSELTYI
jgi:hypothetical protein